MTTITADAWNLPSTARQSGRGKLIREAFRSEVLAACDVNEGTRVIAVRFEVSSGSQKFKCAASREAIEAAGSELHYLPPYSPDLSPIELAFSKLKKLLRDGAERTVDKLWTLCGKALDEFNEHECRNYFKHCGYRYT